jgi:hypothetical protein
MGSSNVLKHKTIVTAASRQIETNVTEVKKKERKGSTKPCIVLIPYNQQLPGKIYDSLRIGR